MGLKSTDGGRSKVQGVYLVSSYGCDLTVLGVQFINSCPFAITLWEQIHCERLLLSATKSFGDFFWAVVQFNCGFTIYSCIMFLVTCNLLWGWPSIFPFGLLFYDTLFFPFWCFLLFSVECPDSLKLFVLQQASGLHILDFPLLYILLL